MRNYYKGFISMTLYLSVLKGNFTFDFAILRAILGRRLGLI